MRPRVLLFFMEGQALRAERAIVKVTNEDSLGGADLYQRVAQALRIFRTHWSQGGVLYVGISWVWMCCTTLHHRMWWYMHMEKTLKGSVYWKEGNSASLVQNF
ncbi:hypothetical protein, unlikely [Trypanosoma brucei gambiense DAL972]|uniref:Uncharacterized protein n=1 Tax=Trypanosoma brucei gambiense (strain MHOM/CI/86/DAL972) TaxID=679716 RepID=C9ZIY4_TRYB9|nr:hypothetical protein, unlikely [Trypanosoma brucei gambiense DAL972]CBH09312.1 hypothetical protein, unlikely [Trypanosoma brucei gambiense DAL972]|eukprot:XP_011771620.1 hypothetical protein, unlikely [Trypanosoma brucei gambiense DAL972]